MDDQWAPWRRLPDDLVWPVRLDPSGRAGPTRGQARGPGWRRTAYGWYVPSAVTPDRVEQRILEAGARLGEREAVTGWAALRWRGAAYFDGLGAGGAPRPIQLIRRSGARNDSGDVVHHRHALAPYDVEPVTGLRCTTTARALFDEMRLAPSVRDAVVALDMTAAAKLISVRLLAEYAEHRSGWEGLPQVREAVGYAVDASRSPQESRLRLVWVLDAGLPEPLVNVPVFDRMGNLLGVPDLLDEEAGLVVEYDGAYHKRRRQHRRDVSRELRFRDHGLEYAAVVGGDLADRSLVVERILAARRRAHAHTARSRQWTVTPPPWWEVPETLDSLLRRAGHTTWPPAA